MISARRGTCRRFSWSVASASRAGAPVYERLGFADAGFIELWELRKA